MPVKPKYQRPTEETTAFSGRRLLITLSVVALGAALALVAPPAIAAPPAEAVDAIGARYAEAGGPASPLGAPSGGAVDVAGGALQDYAGGAIYYSPDSGAKIMYGEILKKYRALGGPGELGFPTNDESNTADGVGKFSDFSEPGGAAIYWNPDAGAWLLTGKVLDAWRASGDVTGPFGYPASDIVSVDGVDTARFVGPDGIQIQWSPTAGLVTAPPALAATLPGFGATAPTTEGTASVAIPTPTVGAPDASAPAADTSSNNNWLWWLLVPLGLALLGGLLWLLGRGRRRTADLRTPDLTRPTVRAPDVDVPDARMPGAPLRRAPDVNAPNLTAPRAQAPDAQRFTAPAAPMPPAANFTAPNSEPPKPKPTTVRPAPKFEAPPPTIDTTPEPPVRHARGERIDVEVGDTPPMEINYESSPDTNGEIEITYENNAIGANQESYDDKSDLHRPGGRRSP